MCHTVDSHATVNIQVKAKQQEMSHSWDCTNVNTLSVVGSKGIKEKCVDSSTSLAFTVSPLIMAVDKFPAPENQMELK